MVFFSENMPNSSYTLFDAKFFDAFGPGLPDANDKPKTFLAAYDEMIADMHNEMAVAKFMSKLASHFLPDEYSINSYLQQDLVAIYGTCEELLHALKHRPILSRDAATRTCAVYERVRLFSDRHESSLQRGPILYGYSKQRKLKHSREQRSHLQRID